ncbi:MAG: hypothetical protein AABN34_28470 [Acidobacteriota bacterium]
MNSSQRNSRKALAGVVAIAILFTVALSTVGGTAPPPPPLLSIGGIAGFAAGQAGININFPAGIKIAGAKYAVVVQETNTAGYSTTSDCTYFNPLHKRDDGFEVQHKRCDNGVPVPLDVNVSLNWIVVEIK